VKKSYVKSDIVSVPLFSGEINFKELLSTQEQ